MNYNYKRYLSTSHWHELKNKALKELGEFCCLCNSCKNLTVHHLFYPKNFQWNDSRVSDLKILCEKCHNDFHAVSPMFNDPIEANKYFEQYIKDKLFLKEFNNKRNFKKYTYNDSNDNKKAYQDYLKRVESFKPSTVITEREKEILSKPISAQGYAAKIVKIKHPV